MRNFDRILNRIATGIVIVSIITMSTEIILTGWDYYYSIDLEFRIGLTSFGRQVSAITLLITWLLYTIPRKLID